MISLTWQERKNWQKYKKCTDASHIPLFKYSACSTETLKWGKKSLKIKQLSLAAQSHFDLSVDRGETCPFMSYKRAQMVV